jgi:hypothetical protein
MLISHAIEDGVLDSGLQNLVGCIHVLRASAVFFVLSASEERIRRSVSGIHDISFLE